MQTSDLAGSEALVSTLRTVVGTDQVLNDPDAMTPFVVDWTRRFGGRALCVVRPETTDEVRSVLRVCAEADVPVVPQGGNTGLVGGSVPGPTGSGLNGPPPVILSMKRMNWIGDVDTLAGQVSCGAGATLGSVQRAALAAGWEYAVDLAARDTATIGGTVATNAGGVRVLAYGMTRAQVVGIEAVMADGTVLRHMPGLLKDNTGFDLAAMLTGSEGTLAVITAVRLRLHRSEGPSSVALIGCASYADALDMMRTAVAPGAALIAAEVMDDTGMGLVEGLLRVHHPLAHRHPMVLLLEVVDGGTGEGFVGLEDRDTVLGLDTDERARLWKFREFQADGFATLGILHKLDVSIPLPQIDACAREMGDLLLNAEDVSGFGIFGHVGDGNLHVEFAGPGPDEDCLDRALLECVAGYDGSISAEHGIGRAKAKYLGLSRSPEEIRVMHAVKTAWDPRGILNPGVIFST